jgi:hypothetical protein
MSRICTANVAAAPCFPSTLHGTTCRCWLPTVVKHRFLLLYLESKKPIALSPVQKPITNKSGVISLGPRFNLSNSFRRLPLGLQQSASGEGFGRRMTQVQRPPAWTNLLALALIATCHKRFSACIATAPETAEMRMSWRAATSAYSSS